MAKLGIIPTSSVPLPFLEGPAANTDVELGLRLIQGGGQAAQTSFMTGALRVVGGVLGAVVSGLTTPNHGESWAPESEFQNLLNRDVSTLTPEERGQYRADVTTAFQRIENYQSHFLAAKQFRNAQAYTSTIWQLHQQLGALASDEKKVEQAEPATVEGAATLTSSAGAPLFDDFTCDNVLLQLAQIEPQMDGLRLLLRDAVIAHDHGKPSQKEITNLRNQLRDLEIRRQHLLVRGTDICPDDLLTRKERFAKDHPALAWLRRSPPVVWVASVLAFFFGLTRWSPTSETPPEKPRQLTQEVLVNDSDGCPKGFALIPAGSFWMGSKTGNPDELPVHKVDLDGYCISRTEVTNGAYGDVTRQSPSPIHFDDPRQPVIYVSWHEAWDYCQAIGGRLPTEAEWERAAKGPQDHRYGTQSGKLTSKEANYNSGGTVAVGSYPPNGYGLYDMTGNVWEWTADWYAEDAYHSHASRNPTGPDSGERKVLRGGSWHYYSVILRAPYRGYYRSPDSRSVDVGFRCVVAPQDSK